MQPATIFNISDASTTLINVSAASQPVFASTIIPAAVLVGVILGGVFVGYFIESIKEAVSWAITRGHHRHTWEDQKNEWLS